MMSSLLPAFPALLPGLRSAAPAWNLHLLEPFSANSNRAMACVRIKRPPLVSMCRVRKAQRKGPVEILSGASKEQEQTAGSCYLGQSSSLPLLMLAYLGILLHAAAQIRPE